MALLDVANLTKQYPTHTAVDNISFSVKAGSVVGILGANGAGKTTTLSMLLGLTLPSSGSIRYFGKPFEDDPSAALQRLGFGTTYAQLPSRLTLAQNLHIYGRLYGIPAAVCAQRCDEILVLLNITHLKNRYTGNLSAGEMTRAVLAKAFIHNPDLILLDEPTASLDVAMKQSIHELIRQRRENGTSFLLTSHDMSEMSVLCDEILIMERGHILERNTPYALAQKVHDTQLSLALTKEAKESAHTYASEHKIPWHEEGIYTTFTLPHTMIAAFLSGCAQRGIEYQDIAIHKPTLEDYVLTLHTRTKRT